MPERLKNIKNALLSCAEGQLSNLNYVDSKEMGEVIGMIRNLEEALYYHQITKAMEEKNWETENSGRMYYNGGGRGGSSSNGGGRSGNGNNSGGNANYGGMNPYYGIEKDWRYEQKEYPYEFRDYREGKSPRSRRMYIESKETHQDKNHQMKELDKYLRELSDDLLDMIKDTSAEEKHLLSQKINELSDKLKQANV